MASFRPCLADKMVVGVSTTCDSFLSLIRTPRVTLVEIPDTIGHASRIASVRSARSQQVSFALETPAIPMCRRHSEHFADSEPVDKHSSRIDTL
jgi:hypothetical protein